jgi:hypothetical protein
MSGAHMLRRLSVSTVTTSRRTRVYLTVRLARRTSVRFRIW